MPTINPKYKVMYKTDLVSEFVTEAYIKTYC